MLSVFDWETIEEEHERLEKKTMINLWFKDVVFGWERCEKLTDFRVVHKRRAFDCEICGVQDNCGTKFEETDFRCVPRPPGTVEWREQECLGAALTGGGRLGIMSEQTLGRVARNGIGWWGTMRSKEEVAAW